MSQPSELESTVLDVWRELFDAQPVGIDDSFFALGGDSLTAAILVARLNSALSIDIQPLDLFRRPTVAQLSGHIESLRRPDGYDLREGVDIRRTDAHQYGGKAATLGDVQQSGCAVPKSLAMPIAAYNDFVHDNALDELVAARAEESAAATPARLLEIEHEIAARFDAATVQPMLEEQVLSWAVRRGITTFAVRSSATNEDLAGATFAGQYDSLLHVPRSSLCSAIKRCYASLFSARAGLYRRRKQIHGIGAMAVLIQEMLSTDHAGVVFTRAPHHPDQMLLELVPGLCEGAVSGTVSPNRYYLDRETLTMRRASERQEYDVEQVRTVARQAMAIERHLGGPQDIEFGLVNGTVYILQARPVAA